jgi:hypothetical protein
MSAGGGNQTWNFANGWMVTDTSVYQYVNVSTLPHASSFPNANLGVNISSPIGDLEGFMLSSASGLFLEGFYTEIPGLVEISTQNSNTVVVPLPLTYGATFNYAQRTVSVVIYNPLFMTPAEKTTTTEQISYICDAWGTLTTPSQTANVLRLRSHITGSVDSVFTDATFTGNNFVFDNTTTYPAETEYDYVFLRNGPSAYLMSCSVDIATGTITYNDYLASGTVSVPELANSVQTMAYPNPANDMLNIRLKGQGVSQFKMFDSSGREAFAYDVNGVDHLSFSTSQFNNGLYVYFLYNSDGQIVGSSKVVVQH